ncbi:MAG: nitrite reductase small subunit NirD [Acidimicrobiales bacterium]
MTVTEAIGTWVDACTLSDLVPDRGACVLIGPYQVALFRLSGDDDIYAVSNYDPFSASFVLSRGIVGSKGDIAKVASPVYKQSFDLRTGQCLDDPSISVLVFPVRLAGVRVEVGMP